jgi:hypothetical protein
MKVYHFGGNEQISCFNEFNSVLSKRYGADSNANDYWIGMDDSNYPQLTILIINDYAFATYVPNENHPGFTSISAGTHLDPNGITVFYNNTPTEWVEFPNHQVISLSLAIKVAEEFYNSPSSLPKSIEWFEL